MVEIISIEPDQGKDFDKIINKKNNVAFVKFYQPTCPHLHKHERSMGRFRKIITR